MSKLCCLWILVQLQCECKHGCWHGFGVNEVLKWLHGKDGCWHDFGANEVLTWLQCKWWCYFIVNVSTNIAFWQRWMLAWLQYKDECWRGFMVKTFNVATLQRLLRWLHWKDKCWCSLIAKTKANTTSMSSTSNSIIVSGIPMITLLPRWLPL